MKRNICYHLSPAYESAVHARLVRGWVCGPACRFSAPLGSDAAVTGLKFLIIFEQRASLLHFALGPVLVL